MSDGTQVLHVPAGCVAVLVRTELLDDMGAGWRGPVLVRLAPDADGPTGWDMQFREVEPVPPIVKGPEGVTFTGTRSAGRRVTR